MNDIEHINDVEPLNKEIRVSNASNDTEHQYDVECLC